MTLTAGAAHLGALRSNGLTVKSLVLSDFTIRVRAPDDPHEGGAVDLVLFCVKTYDLEAAAEQSRPLLGQNTLVIPVQNGIEVLDNLCKKGAEGRRLRRMEQYAARRSDQRQRRR